jgi:hypothetical protein
VEAGCRSYGNLCSVYRHPGSTSVLLLYIFTVKTVHPRGPYFVKQEASSTLLQTALALHHPIRRMLLPFPSINKEPIVARVTRLAGYFFWGRRGVFFWALCPYGVIEGMRGSAG